DSFQTVHTTAQHERYCDQQETAGSYESALWCHFLIYHPPEPSVSSLAAAGAGASWRRSAVSAAIDCSLPLSEARNGMLTAPGAFARGFFGAEVLGGFCGGFCSPSGIVLSPVGPIRLGVGVALGGTDSSEDSDCIGIPLVSSA